MLNKIKNKVKLLFRFYKIKQITYQNYQEYKEYFINQDENSNWDPSSFSKIILNNLEDKNKLNLVEIGVARGATSKFTIEKLGEKISSYTGIDPYESNYDQKDEFSYFNQQLMDNLYRFVIEKVNDPRFVLIRKKSNLAYLEFEDNSIDAIYIDGDHRYKRVLEDIKNWKPKVKKGGLLIGDDYLTFSDVRKAVNESFSDFCESGNTWFVVK